MYDPFLFSSLRLMFPETTESFMAGSSALVQLENSAPVYFPCTDQKSVSIFSLLAETPQMDLFFQKNSSLRAQQKFPFLILTAYIIGPIQKWTLVAGTKICPLCQHNTCIGKKFPCVAEPEWQICTQKVMTWNAKAETDLQFCHTIPRGWLPGTSGGTSILGRRSRPGEHLFQLSGPCLGCRLVCNEFQSSHCPRWLRQFSPVSRERCLIVFFVCNHDFGAVCWTQKFFFVKNKTQMRILRPPNVSLETESGKTEEHRFHKNCLWQMSS